LPLIILGFDAFVIIEHGDRSNISAGTFRSY
jgi:hypothetical protein